SWWIKSSQRGSRTTDTLVSRRVPCYQRTVLALAALAVVHLVPARIERAPRIDGRLDDVAWTVATPSGDFTQKFPADGGAPGDPTTVRIAYDDQDLYVAIAAPQSVPIVER